MRKLTTINIYHTSLPATVRLLSIILLLFTGSNLLAQQKSVKKIKIEGAELWEQNSSIAADASRLIDSVILSHENIIMKCDSAWLYSQSNSVDAFGRVHIISNDTLNLWADFMFYDGNTGMTKARNNVKLKDPSLTLITDSLDFDMNEEVGYYKYGGKIIDSTNVLNSKTGTYYSKLNEVHFIDNVRLKNEEYTLRTDTMMYNTETEVVVFEGPTNIWGDSTTVYASSGWFNTKTNELELDKSATIKRGDTQLQADFIYYNDNTGDGNANGNVIINDFANQMIVVGKNAEYDDFNRYALVTDSAMWIQYYNNDSLFLHADTLYTVPDTTAEGQKKLITYNHVRFYRTDIQGVSDSLIYFTRDSTIQLFLDPVIWSDQNQMSANFIEFKNNAKPPNEVYLNDNSFIIQKNDSTKFNQIKGKNMVGYIRGQELNKIDVNGNGQSIYYPADEREYLGINKAESSKIIIYVKENQINRITFSGAPKGIMTPLPENITPETRLEGFEWREDERPVNRYDIFGNEGLPIAPKDLPDSKIENILEDNIDLLKDNLDLVKDNLDLVKDSLNVLLDSIDVDKILEKMP